MTLSNHARTRCQQRSVSHDGLMAAIDWGRPYSQPQGRTAYFLGRRQVGEAKCRGVNIRGFQGTVVVVSDDDVVITVVRAQNPRRLKRWGRR